ncbi:MAG: cupin domain-containing protein [Bacilli bacterium]
MNQPESAGSYGPIGTRILFENDLFRIWEVVLEPGEEQGIHHHTHPYVVIAIEPGNNKITSIDGSVRLTEEVLGHFVFQEAGQIHNLENVGTTRYRNRLIEFKAPQAPTDGEVNHD